MQAGWMQDPTGRHQYRYHDGAHWTEHVSDNGTTSLDPYDRPAMPPPPPGSASAPAPSLPAAQQPAPARTPAPPPVSPATPIVATKPIWKRWWFLGGVGVILLAVVAAAFAGSDDAGDSTEPAAADADRDDTTDEAADPDEPAEDPAADDAETGETGESDTADDSDPDETAASDADSDSSDDTAADDTDDDDQAEPDEPAVDDGVAASSLGLPNADDGPVPIGQALREDDDVVRVNAVFPDAPAGEFFQPDPGFTLTLVEVEACGGEDGFNANPLYWTAFLDDNTAADNFLFADDFETIGLRPGACTRGLVSFEVPDGHTVTSVVLTGALLEETARWTEDGAIPVTDRLQPHVTADSWPVNTAIEFGAGHTAEVRSVTDGAAPLSDFFEPEPGRQFTQIDVELCAGTEPLPVNPLYWLGATTENWMGSAALSGSTLDAIELASGQCIAGLVELDLPEGSVTSSVALTDIGLDEVARWTIG